MQAGSHADRSTADPKHRLRVPCGGQQHTSKARKAAGDMYADSVLRSSPMVTFGQFSKSNCTDVCNEIGQSPRCGGSTSPPCCTQTAPLSQLRYNFTNSSENCGVKGNTGGSSLCHTAWHMNTSQSADQCPRLSRSLSKSQAGRGASLDRILQHSPVVRLYEASLGTQNAERSSLSPSSMRRAEPACNSPLHRAEDTNGEFPCQ